MDFKQNEPSMEDMMRFAASPSGKKLISYLQAYGGDSLNQAKKAAESGNYEQAKANLSKLMQSPDFQKLMQEMEK